jgi:glycosyltransferase involved in cell wall biosynthesis
MSDQPPQIQHNTRPSYLVSAIVSTYRSAKFIRGRIEDLLNQTIASQIEIIVVDSGSPENEGEIVEEFTTRFPNVRYIRTAQRETIYAAWNRGIETATGKYLTNANTDDRLRRDALETLVRALESNPSKSVAHARQLITCVPNQPFGSTTPIGAHDWPQVTRDNILLNCNVGPQPLWRRNLHTTFGLFDARLEVAGDYDFWIRCCLGGADFILIPEHLGTYYRSPEGANKEFENRFRTFSETYAVQRRGIVKLLEAKSTGDLQSIVNRARVRIDNLLAQPAARPEMSGLQQLEHVFWEASVALEMLKKFNLSRDLARSFFDVVNHSHKLAFHLREIANFSDPTAPAPTGPLVSVIIVCEDCESTLARTLPSVLKQSYRYLELFFISDDSSDEAARLITDFTAKYSAMTLTVLRRPKLHAIAAKNSAATDAKGEFILFLTSGDELASDFINQSIQTLHSNPTVDVVFTEAVLFGAENKIRPANEVTLPALYSINQLPETYLVRRAAFHDAGGFDEGLKYYADWDLWISLAKSGSKFKALQKPLFFSCRKAASHSPDHSCSEASLKAALMSRHPDIYRHPQASDPSSLLDTTKSSTVSNLTQIIRPRPKISFITIVLNGMPFLEASLKSVYKHAHEIIIIEGAVEKCRFAAKPDGSSLDGSVECIQCFPDPERKIRMVQGIWPEKNEMQNKALELVTGEYIWLLDSDEVYREKDIEKVEAILKSDPSITQISFIAHNFWKGFEFIFESKKFKEPGYQYRRVFRFLPGSRFLTHRPPTLSYPGESRTADQIRPISLQLRHGKPSATEDGAVPPVRMELSLGV